MVMDETLLKAYILTHGVEFSDKALIFATKNNAKRQNMVYNMPIDSTKSRPQELLIRHIDGYETVVSCVASCKDNPVLIDIIEGKIVAYVKDKVVKNVTIEFVKEPEYYQKILNSGQPIRNYVSACGLDELNILPWQGCAISQCCLFCGTNTVRKNNDSGVFTAFDIANEKAWEMRKSVYLKDLKEALSIAIKSSCYNDHMHVILISGDLSDEKLDLQSKIYAEIAEEISPILSEKSSEGIIAVMMPPNDMMLLEKLYKTGISKVVFNFEVGNEELFNKYCPGKKNIGYNHIYKSLEKAVEIFGVGNAWSNFVLGLEPIEHLLKFNEELVKKGIVPSANILHLDKGNRLDCSVPKYDTVIEYFYKLSQVLKEHNMKPYYCSKALRTSLSNEAYDGRIKM